MTKVIEYVHEYDEPDWEYVNKERVDYISHLTETFYAISDKENFTRTDKDGKTESDSPFMGEAFGINGSTLTVYNRQDILGLMGLLTKLLDEYPEEEK